jgi:hypothetical protein
MIPMTLAHNGDHWATHFVCESTGWHVIYMHLSKDQLNNLINQFIAWVKTQFSVRLKRIFSDHKPTLRGEYIRTMQTDGTEIYYSTQYINKQKGLIKRARQTVIEMAQSM